MKKLLVILVLMFMSSNVININAEENVDSFDCRDTGVIDSNLKEIQIKYTCDITLVSVKEGEEVGIKISDTAKFDNEFKYESDDEEVYDNEYENPVSVTQEVKSDEFYSGYGDVDIETKLNHVDNTIDTFKSLSNTDINITIHLLLPSYSDKGIDFEIKRDGVIEILNFNLDDTILYFSDIGDKLIYKTDGIEYDKELGLYYQDFVISAPEQYYNYQLNIQPIPIIIVNDSIAYNYSTYAEYNTLNNEPLKDEILNKYYFTLINGNQLELHLVLGSDVSTATYSYVGKALEYNSGDSFTEKITYNIDYNPINVHKLLKNPDILIVAFLLLIFVSICYEKFRNNQKYKKLVRDFYIFSLILILSLINFFCFDYLNIILTIYLFQILLISYLIYSDFKILYDTFIMSKRALLFYVLMLIVAIGSILLFLANEIYIVVVIILLILHLSLLFSYYGSSVNAPKLRTQVRFEIAIDFILLFSPLYVGKLILTNDISVYLYYSLMCIFYAIIYILLKHAEIINFKSKKFKLILIVLILLVISVFFYSYSRYDLNLDQHKYFEIGGGANV